MNHDTSTTPANLLPDDDVLPVILSLEAGLGATLGDPTFHAIATDWRAARTIAAQAEAECDGSQRGGEVCSACAGCVRLLESERDGLRDSRLRALADLNDVTRERDGLATQVEIMRAQVVELNMALDLASREGRAALERADEHATRAQALDEQASACAREVVAAREREREAIRLGEQAALVAASELRACNRLELAICRVLAGLGGGRVSMGEAGIERIRRELSSALSAPEVDPGAPVELTDAAPDLAAASREAWTLTVARLLWERNPATTHRDCTGDAAALLDLLEGRLCKCSPMLRGAGMRAHFRECPARVLWLVTLIPAPFAVPEQVGLQVAPDMDAGRGRR